MALTRRKFGGKKKTRGIRSHTRKRVKRHTKNKRRSHKKRKSRKHKKRRRRGAGETSPPPPEPQHVGYINLDKKKNVEAAEAAEAANREAPVTPDRLTTGSAPPVAPGAAGATDSQTTRGISTDQRTGRVLRFDEEEEDL